MAEILDFAPGVTLERAIDFDRFSGALPALLAAGVIEHHQLTPQVRRRKGCTYFMPDGSPLPECLPFPTSMPGALSIQNHASGRCEVRRVVTMKERSARQEAASTLRWSTDEMKSYYGPAHRLIRDGIPAAWLEGLPAPGKKRGRRRFEEAGNLIEVSASEAGFSVDVSRIPERPPAMQPVQRILQPQRPTIVRRHLSLVWSNDRKAVCHG